MNGPSNTRFKSFATEVLKYSLVGLVGTFLFIGSAFALKESHNGRCTLSAEVLADPDAVILDAMENATQSSSLNCKNTPIAETEKWPLPGPHFPLRANKLKGAGWGIYRDFRIHGSKPGEPLEGYETRIYDVELIYVAMIMDGPTRPICEKAHIPMRVVKTPWGWRLIPRHSFGSSLKGEIDEIWHVDSRSRKMSEEVATAWRDANKSEQKELETFASQCKLRLD